MDNNELTQDPNSDTPNNIGKKSYFKILNQKGNFVIILGVVLIALFVTIGIYVLAIRKNQPVNQDYVQEVNPSQVQPIQPIPNNVDKIAFIRSGEVWIMNEDGTEQKKILSHTPITFKNPNITPEDNKVISNTFNNKYYANLAWSKDGTHLAVTAFSKAIEEEGQNEKFELIKKAPGEMWRWQPPHGNIFLIDVNTGKYQVIESKEKNLMISQIQWSYDNKQIIYARERMGVRIPDEVVLFDIDSYMEKVLLTNESDGAENVGLLTWFPEKGEFWFLNGVAYHVDNPKPGLIRFNYLKNQKDRDPLEVSQGYRLGNYRFLKDGRIIYYNKFLGPNFDVNYDYEIRISNYDGSDSKVIFSGDDCYSQTKEKCARFFGFSPNGEYALSVKNKIAYYKPFSTETPLFEELTFGNVESFKGSYHTTWNKDENKIAYLLNVSGIVVVQDISDKTQKTIIKDPNITEIEWAF